MPKVKQKASYQLLREVKVSSAVHVRICVVQRPRYVVQTEKSWNLKRTLDRHIESINKTENIQLDELLTRAILCSGSPLFLVESEDVTTFITKLHPGMLPQGPHCLTRSWKKSTNVLKDEAPALTLHTYAWIDQRNASVRNFVVISPEPFFSFKTL